MTGLNIYLIKLDCLIEGDKVTSRAEYSVLSTDAENALFTAKEELKNWYFEDSKYNEDPRKIAEILLHECKLEFENIDIISKRVIANFKNERK